MSIKKELREKSKMIKKKKNTLERKKKYFKKKLRKICSILNDLNITKKSIEQKERLVQNMESSLSKTLFKKQEKELTKVNNKLNKVIEKKDKNEKKLKETNKKIKELNDERFKMENDFNLYIEEQSTIMSNKFIKYIRNHIEDIGVEIKKTYKIEPKTLLIWCGKYTYYQPTGIIEIYELKKSFDAISEVYYYQGMKEYMYESIIVSSKDFYFKKKLYTIYTDDKGTIVNYTDWFKNYYNSFISNFSKKLKENYSFDEDLKLTIKGSYITLELV